MHFQLLKGLKFHKFPGEHSPGPPRLRLRTPSRAVHRALRGPYFVVGRELERPFFHMFHVRTSGAYHSTSPKAAVTIHGTVVAIPVVTRPVKSRIVVPRGLKVKKWLATRLISPQVQQHLPWEWQISAAYFQQYCSDCFSFLLALPARWVRSTFMP